MPGLDEIQHLMDDKTQSLLRSIATMIDMQSRTAIALHVIEESDKSNRYNKETVEAAEWWIKERMRLVIEDKKFLTGQ